MCMYMFNCSISDDARKVDWERLLNELFGEWHREDPAKTWAWLVIKRGFQNFSLHQIKCLKNTCVFRSCVHNRVKLCAYKSLQNTNPNMQAKARNQTHRTILLFSNTWIQVQWSRKQIKVGKLWTKWCCTWSWRLTSAVWKTSRLTCVQTYSLFEPVEFL